MLIYKVKNIKLRKIFNSIEKTKKINKFILVFLLNKRYNIKLKKKLFFFFNLYKKSKIKSFVRITRRCLYTNRNRGIFRLFNISRVYLRELLSFGILPGYKKAVW